MVPFKPRTKILLIVGMSKVIFSGNKKDAQIATLGNGVEVRAHKLSTAFRFKADGYRTIEVPFEQIAADEFKVKLPLK
jgi:hypothetical protein